MADNTNIIVVGNVAFTDKGAWVKGYSFEFEGETIQGYDANDIVHTANGVYASLIDGNTSEPSDTSESWRLWLDKTAATKARSAADDANKAANLANTAVLLQPHRQQKHSSRLQLQRRRRSLQRRLRREQTRKSQR